MILIGTGNVAHHLGPALQNAGHEIFQLIGRNKERTRELAEKLNVDLQITQ
ncbi:MAG: NAD(P)-binding domain-containing protein [Bacteroidota bacterium]|nr:NAD(P)-binding domain-containing protein [Bacteroidota bacterium]